MLTRKSVLSLVRLALAFTMAFPPSLYAKEAGPADFANTKDTIPAVLIPVQTKDGQQGEIRITMETPEQEMRAIPAMIAHDPSHFILAVTAKDSLFGVVARSTPVDKLITMVVGEAKDFPLLKDETLPPSLRSKVRDGFQKLQDTFGKVKYGLTVAVSVGGIQGGFTFHASSSIPQASQVALAATALNGYQIIYAHSWDKFMDFGGHAVLRTADYVNGLMAKAFSREAHVMTNLEKRSYETVGKYAMSMALNSATTTYVLMSAGEYESPGQVMHFGALATTDVSDSIINERQRLGILSQRFAQNWGYFRVVFGAMGDVGNYMHAPGVSTTLAVLTFGTFVYSIFGRELETKVFMPKIVNPTRAFASATAIRAAKVRSQCESRLTKFAAPKVAQIEEQ